MITIHWDKQDVSFLQTFSQLAWPSTVVFMWLHLKKKKNNLREAIKKKRPQKNTRGIALHYTNVNVCVYQSGYTKEYSFVQDNVVLLHIQWFTFIPINKRNYEPIGITFFYNPMYFIWDTFFFAKYVSFNSTKQESVQYNSVMTTWNRCSTLSVRMSSFMI